MIKPFFKKIGLFLLPLLTAGMLNAQDFKPIPLGSLEIKSFSGLTGSFSNFISQVKPEAAGQIVFLTAALAMNPQTAAIDLNKPLRMVLLTGAGKAVTDNAGQYRPDLFFCLSAYLRKGAAIDNSISTLAGTLATRRLPDDRILLYSPHPLFDKHLNAIEKKFFPVSSGLPDLELNLNFQAISRIPEVTEGIKNGVMMQPKWNPSYDDALSNAVDNLAKQISDISLKLNFLDASTISITGNLMAEPGSELAAYTKHKNNTAFDNPSTFKTADSYTLISIPPTTELKRILLKQLGPTGIPAYAEEGIMRSNGKVLISENRALQLVKISFELENGAMPPILAAMKKEKSIQQLQSGIWMLDYQENKISAFAEVRDNKFLLAAGPLTEQAAQRLLNDPTPLPEQIELGNSAIANFIKLKNDTIVRKCDIKYTPGRINFSFKISASDFPKPSSNSRKN